MSAILTTKIVTEKEEFSGVFDDDVELMDFGQAGRRKPNTWSLSVTKVSQITAAGESIRNDVFYNLNLKTEKPPTSFTGKFGWPIAGRMSDYDYGYGAAGFLKDVRKSILEKIGSAVGLDLLAISQKDYKNR